MLGLSWQRLGNRERVIVLAIWAIVGLSVLAPSSAHAGGCEDSWTNSAGGSWFVGANWSKKAPPASGEEVCITKSGSYTVEMTQTTGTVSVKSLTIGGSSGTQTLTLGSSCSLNAVLTTTSGISNGARGAITLTNGDGCANNVTVSGPIANTGKLTTEPGHGGARIIQGNLTNTGTFAIKTNTLYNGTGAVLTNAGTINIAEGTQMSVSGGGAVASNSGKIIGAGSGNLSQVGGTFTERAGTTYGVVLDDATLVYTGTSAEHGSGAIELRGASVVSGNVRTEELLVIESTCSENAVATAAASFYSAGTIALTNGDGCANNATLNMKDGTLTNTGTLSVVSSHGGVRLIKGNLLNESTMSVAAGETLQISGNFTQSSKGRLETYIVGPSSFGSVSVTGAAALAGKLTLFPVSPFMGSLGQTFAIVGSSSLTGKFATETEGQIDLTGLYYEPTYSATGVTLLVAQATMSLSASSGPPGSTLTISGSGYPPGDTVTPKLMERRSAVVVWPAVTTNAGGEYSTEVTIPPSSRALGHIRVTSSEAGVYLTAWFMVTSSL